MTQTGRGPVHVFDQTNGVLGEHTDWAESPAEEPRTPPRTFGVPPLTSL